MRDFSITRKEGEWYNAEVTDSYGNEYQNYFETAYEANKWIYYVWEKEDWFNSVDSQELLYNAIQQCKEIDEKSNRRKILQYDQKNRKKYSGNNNDNTNNYTMGAWIILILITMMLYNTLVKDE